MASQKDRRRLHKHRNSVIAIHNQLFLSVLLKIAGTVAVTSCESERSGNILKRLNTYLHEAMR